MSERPLTEKQQAFVAEYLKDRNGTQAAIRAGYSARTADAQAVALLRKTEVRRQILAGQTEVLREAKVDAAWLLRRLADEATADLADLYDEENNLLPVHKWPKIWRMGLVQGIEVEEIFEGRGEDRVQIGVLRKIKLDNRVKRLELIGKHVDVRAFQEQLEITVNDNRAERLARARERRLALATGSDGTERAVDAEIIEPDDE